MLQGVRIINLKITKKLVALPLILFLGLLVIGFNKIIVTHAYSKSISSSVVKSGTSINEIEKVSIENLKSVNSNNIKNTIVVDTSITTEPNNRIGAVYNAEKTLILGILLILVVCSIGICSIFLKEKDN